MPQSQCIAARQRGTSMCREPNRVSTCQYWPQERATIHCGQTSTRIRLQRPPLYQTENWLASQRCVPCHTSPSDKRALAPALPSAGWSKASKARSYTLRERSRTVTLTSERVQRHSRRRDGHWSGRLREAVNEEEVARRNWFGSISLYKPQRLLWSNH